MRLRSGVRPRAWIFGPSSLRLWTHAVDRSKFSEGPAIKDKIFRADGSDFFVFNAVALVSVPISHPCFLMGDDALREFPPTKRLRKSVSFDETRRARQGVVDGKNVDGQPYPLTDEPAGVGVGASGGDVYMGNFGPRGGGGGKGGRGTGSGGGGGSGGGSEGRPGVTPTEAAEVGVPTPSSDEGDAHDGGRGEAATGGGGGGRTDGVRGGIGV